MEKRWLARFLYRIGRTIIGIKLSLNVVKLRTQYRVACGDGGFYELQTAIRVHGNAVEYIPIYDFITYHGNEWRLCLDGTYLWFHFNSRSSSSLLRVETPRDTLASLWYGRNLFINGLNDPLLIFTSFLGYKFFPSTINTTRKI